MPSDQMPFWLVKSYDAKQPGFGFWLCHCLRDFVQLASNHMAFFFFFLSNVIEVIGLMQLITPSYVHKRLTQTRCYRLRCGHTGSDPSFLPPLVSTQSRKGMHWRVFQRAVMAFNATVTRYGSTPVADGWPWPTYAPEERRLTWLCWLPLVPFAASRPAEQTQGDS